MGKIKNWTRVQPNKRQFEVMKWRHDEGSLVWIEHHPRAPTQTYDVFYRYFGPPRGFNEKQKVRSSISLERARKNAVDFMRSHPNG